YGAAQIAAVKPEQRHCGRGEDQGGRQRRLERHPARHIVISANGRGQGQRLPELTKPTTGEEKKAEAERGNSGAPISDFETSRLSGGVPDARSFPASRASAAFETKAWIFRSPTGQFPALRALRDALRTLRALCGRRGPLRRPTSPAIVRTLKSKESRAAPPSKRVMRLFPQFVS